MSDRFAHDVAFRTGCPPALAQFVNDALSASGPLPVTWAVPDPRKDPAAAGCPKTRKRQARETRTRKNRSWKTRTRKTRTSCTRFARYGTRCTARFGNCIRSRSGAHAITAAVPIRTPAIQTIVTRLICIDRRAASIHRHNRNARPSHLSLNAERCRSENGNREQNGNFTQFLFHHFASFQSWTGFCEPGRKNTLPERILSVC